MLSRNGDTVLLRAEVCFLEFESFGFVPPCSRDQDSFSPVVSVYRRHRASRIGRVADKLTDNALLELHVHGARYPLQLGRAVPMEGKPV